MSEKNKENTSEGLHLDKKAIMGITAILAVVWVLAGVLTRVVPRGEYSTFTDPDTGKASITAESVYSPVEDYTMPVWKIIAAPVMVFVEEETRDNGMTGLLIIAFIVILGGTFLLLDRSGVLKYLVAVIIKKFSKKKYVLLAVMTFFLMFLSSTAGILEESVTFVPIAVAISLALGWDSLVGLGMSLVAVGFGFTAATFNPFNVMTTQKIAGDVEIFSGLWLRAIIFVLVYLILFGFLFFYAKKIERDPTKSPAYESDKALREKYTVSSGDELLSDKKTARSAKVFALCLLLAFLCIAADFIFGMGGTLSMGGIAGFFFVGGLAAAYTSGIRGKKLLSGFVDGIKTISPALPLIVIIIAIAYILNCGKIMHTILYYVYGLLDSMSPYGAIMLIFVFIAVLEFFISSGTAKAFLVMPLVIPLAHLIGLSTNSVVVAFCLADGFANLLYPTSGIMVIAIGLIGVSYSKWFKFSWKLFLIEGLLSVAIMAFTVFIGYK